MPGGSVYWCVIDRVLVPMDGSEMSERALEYTLEAFPEAEVTVLHVVGEPSPMWGKAVGLAVADDLGERAEEVAEPVLDRAREIADEHERRQAVSTRVRLGHPVRSILDLAADHDTVVVGGHGGSVSDRLYVGNVASRVVRRSPCPVIVVR